MAETNAAKAKKESKLTAIAGKKGEQILVDKDEIVFIEEKKNGCIVVLRGGYATLVACKIEKLQ